MNRRTKYLIFVSITLPLLLATIGNGEKRQQQPPDATERAIGITTPTNPWGKIQAWIKQGLLNLLQGSPDPEKAQKPPPNTGDLMKDAIAKSYETSKSTAEDLGKITGKAAKKTAETVKGAFSSSGSDQEEL